MRLGTSLAINRIGQSGVPAAPDPIPDFLVHYKLDGTDAITRLGTNDFRAAKESPLAKGCWNNGTDQGWNADINSDVFATLGGGGFTICFWYNTAYSGGQTEMLGNGTGTAAGTMRIRHQTSGAQRIRIDGTNYATTGSAPDGEWHFCVFTLTGSGGTVTGAIDDVETLNTTVSAYADLSDSGSFDLCVTGAGGWFPGGLNGVRIYDRVLSGAEQTTLFEYRDDYNPTQITTVGRWDPSQITTVTEAAGLVSQIDDIGTSGTEDLVQGTGANQPAIGTRFFNTMNIADCDGARAMTRASFPVPASGNLSIMMIAGVDVISSVNDSLVSLNATNDFQLDAANASDFDGELDVSGIGSSVALTSTPHNGPSIYNIIFDFTGGFYAVYVDGVQYGANTTYSTKLDASQTLGIFIDRALGAPPDGFFGEIIIKEDVTEAGRQDDEAYMAWKWFPTTTLGGNNPNLPAGHPNRMSPPLES